MRWLNNIINIKYMNLSKFWEIVKNRGAWCAAVHKAAKSQTQLRNWKLQRKLESIFEADYQILLHIELAKKYVWVFPYCLMEKPEWTFWPTQ